MVQSVLERYFSDDQIRAGTLSGGEFRIGGLTFAVENDQLQLIDAGDDKWLNEFTASHDANRSAWAAVAFLKVRHFDNTATISEKARSGELYNEDYFTKRGGGSPYVGYPLEEGGFDSSQRFGVLAEEIIDRFHPATVLDMGCATGVLVKALQERGVDAHGVDISEWAVENAIAPNIRHANAVSLPFDGRSFDVIISQDFMEHIHPEDLPAVLSEQKRVLRPNGKLVHFIPFYENSEPEQQDAHLCNANRAWWLDQFQKAELNVLQTAPQEDQWGPGPQIDRYFVLERASDE